MEKRINNLNHYKNKLRLNINSNSGNNNNHRALTSKNSDFLKSITNNKNNDESLPPINLLYYTNKIMNKSKRRIYSSQNSNKYNIDDNYIFEDTNKSGVHKFITLSNSKIGKVENKAFHNTNNNNNNLSTGGELKLNLELELEDNINHLNNELKTKNKILNNYIKIISDYKGTISQLFEKNKTLEQNSVNLLNQIEHHKEEIKFLKQENSFLINKNINFNRNYNMDCNEQIKYLKQQLNKYKIANNNLKNAIITNLKSKNILKDKINIYNDKIKKDYKRKNIHSNKKYKEDI